MSARAAARLLCAAMVLACAPAMAADATPQAAALLERAARALASLHWSGVYVHAAAGQSESYRTTRRVDATGDAERVEALEGTAREILRQGEDIHLFLPASREVRIERRIASAGFPQVLPADPGTLAQTYRLSVAGSGRVASREALIVRLEASDALRYSREIWIDRESALPLKVRVLDASGATLEQTAFSEVRIGQPVPASRVRPGRQVGYAGWDVQRLTAPLPVGATVPDAALLGPGFRVLGGAARRAAGTAPPATHWAFGDGLAVVSVFVEDASRTGTSASPVAGQRGALGVVETSVAGRRLTAVGEAPRALLERGLAAVGALQR